MRRSLLTSLTFLLLLLPGFVTASPDVSCWLEYNGEESTLAVPAASDVLDSGWKEMGRFRLRTLLALPPLVLPANSQPWLQIEVYAQAADDDYRIISTQKVGAPFATGRMEVVEPRLGRSLRYECGATKDRATEAPDLHPDRNKSLGASLLPPGEITSGKAKVAFVGDVMLGENEATGRLLAAGGDPLAKVRQMLAAADLRVANFESSAGTKGQPDPDKPYSFRTAQSALKPFSAVFEAASLANNHAGDFGRADFVETLNALQAAGTKTFGGGRNPAEAHQPVILERNGVNIALLGYLDFFPRWFAAAPGLPGVAWLDADLARQDIARVRAAGADVVIVIPHWGMEDEPRANDRQRRLARALIDAGADAVIGGHPHVVQDYEIYREKPIVYSLGNFVFDGFEDETNLTGWVVFADIDRTGVSAITTRVVHIDADGSPAPNPDKTGPCWRRGETAMAACAKQPAH